MILLSHELFKRAREETDPELLEEARIRGVIDTLARVGDYWTVMRWLSHRAGQAKQSFTFITKFWSLDEAVAYFAARQDRGDEMRCALAVARHFRELGPEAWS